MDGKQMKLMAMSHSFCEIEKIFFVNERHENFGTRNTSSLNFRPKSLGGH